MCIARALVSRPLVLVCDEATSALDKEGESTVQAAIDAALVESGATAVVIAHRLSAVKKCDVVCVVEGGRAAEVGARKDLIQVRGSELAKRRAEKE